jgi:hypothetical protein
MVSCRVRQLCPVSGYSCIGYHRRSSRHSCRILVLTSCHSFTYWVGGIVATQVHERPIECNQREFSIFSPPAGQSCGQYLAAYLQYAPGKLDNPNDTTDCRYCSLRNADQYVGQSEIYWDQRWRNYGIFWAFIVFNAFIAVLTYWAFRVKKWKGISLKGKKEGKREKETDKKEKSSHFNMFRR